MNLSQAYARHDAKQEALLALDFPVALRARLMRAVRALGPPCCLQQDGLVYIDDPARVGLRHVHNVMPEPGHRNSWTWLLNSTYHYGWHTDPDGDVFHDGFGLCWGVVYQLPGRHGASRLLVGYQFGGIDDGPVLDLSFIYEVRSDAYGWSLDNPLDNDNLRAALCAADQLAQRAAEDECAYQQEQREKEDEDE